MLGKLFGVVCILLGSVIGLWLAYNLLVVRDAVTEDMSPVPAIMFTIGLFYVGINRLKKKSEDSVESE